MSAQRSKVVLSLLTGLVAGALLSTLQLSCGVVQQQSACAAEECPPGPQGPEGPAGPTGPAGPGFDTCKWHYNTCNAAPNVECQVVCPAGTHPASGGCDVTNGGTIAENYPAVDANATFPPTPAGFVAYDRWVCQSSAGNVQTTFALCCAP